jgi:hypothetical protein
VLGFRQKAAAASLLAVGVLAPAWGQAGIYTCVDAKGRRITSDRPIAECLDREQKELSPSGTVKRRIGPSLTAQERAAEEERARKLADAKQREAEERRREKVLTARYPDQAAHDRERQRALDSIEDVIEAAQQRTLELQAQRKGLLQETEFYKADPSRMPAKLKRQLEENEEQTAAQMRFVASQQDERQRINARFDDELAKLRTLWDTSAARR